MTRRLRMLRRGVGAVLAVLAVLVAGCDGVCTLSAVTSVLVEVVDAQGQPVPRATVRGTCNGDPIAVSCPNRDENSSCDLWWVGVEQPGFFVTAEAPGGATGTAIAFVDVTEDGCHVETEQLRIVVE